MRRNKRYDKEEFIEKANEIHNGKYDYSEIKYVNNKIKICIICPIHGEFWQRPNDHLNKHGCPKCSHRSYKKTTDEFVDDARKVHGDKYDYSKVRYLNNLTKVIITCPIHGDFEQSPSGHLQGYGCPACGGVKKGTTETFIERAKEIHGNKYDYIETIYTTAFNKVKIICPVHGVFYQVAHEHLRGCGCPKCGQSHMETDVMNYLEGKRIKYIPQYKYDNQHKLSSLDFYLPDYKIGIECQGEQHFEPVDFGNNGKEYAEEWFIKNLSRDKTKFDRCNELNIKLFYYIPKNREKYIDNTKYNFIYRKDNVINDISELFIIK